MSTVFENVDPRRLSRGFSGETDRIIESLRADYTDADADGPGGTDRHRVNGPAGGPTNRLRKG